MEDKEAIMALKDEECYTIPESDYGKAEIWYINGYYFLFSIPIYGGRPVFEQAVDKHNSKEKQVDKVLEIINNWT